MDIASWALDQKEHIVYRKVDRSFVKKKKIHFLKIGAKAHTFIK